METATVSNRYALKKRASKRTVESEEWNW